MRNNVLPSQLQQSSIKLQPLLLRSLQDSIPVKAREFKSFGIIRVGDPLSRDRIAEPGETGELITSTCRNRCGQALLEIAKKQKGRLRSKLLSHKEQRWRRREQQNRRRRTHRARISNRQNPLPKRAISDLIVIL